MGARCFFVASLIVSLSVSAAAQTAGSQQSPPASSDEIVVKGQIADPDKKVCKTEAATGSIIPKRVCRPKWQWELMRQRSLALKEQLDRDRRGRQLEREALENK